MIKKQNVLKKYNLPEKVEFCKKCTISNQRPRITFDEEGVCSACNFAEFKKNKIDWNKREEELIAILDQFRKNDGSYDVLVPASGGKDTSFAAHELKHKYGMNPLTVTWAPHLYTDIGFKNHQNMIHKGNLANIMGAPSGNTHRKLTKISFEILGDPFQPFIYGQTNFPLQIAVNFNIPLIMYGENGEVEYGGDMKNAFSPTRDYRSDHTKHYFSGLPPEALTDYGVDMNDLVPYMPPKNEALDAIGAQIHFYGYYKKWVPQEHYYYCVENTGFSANPVRSEGTYSKYASLDDRLDGFHYYLSYIKFGIGRATSDSAHEIRDGHITRDEGVALVRKFDGEFPVKHYETFLEYCNIDDAHFNEIIDSWRSPHIWSRIDGEWKLNHTVSNDGIKD